MIHLLASHPWVATGAAAVLGLIVGSFLNVVIHRLPRMLERAWRRECAEVLGAAAPEPGERYDLVVPRSTCPSCGHRIRALENVPVLSYLALRGRCAACGWRIPLRYPLVEIACAALSAAVVAHFGATPAAAGGLLLTWGLLALAFIDVDTQLLPDDVTLPLLWAGLLFNLAGTFVPLADAVLGAALGYGVLWSVYWLFRLATGKEGMGYGDFKLLAALGAWQGWQALPAVILLSSLVGAVVGGALLLARRAGRGVPIPFGPYLAAAGWITLLWGEAINGAYLRWAATPW